AVEGEYADKGYSFGPGRRDRNGDGCGWADRLESWRPPDRQCDLAAGSAARDREGRRLGSRADGQRRAARHRRAEGVGPWRALRAAAPFVQLRRDGWREGRRQPRRADTALRDTAQYGAAWH